MPSADSSARVAELLTSLYTCETSDECVGLAADLGGVIKTLGLRTLLTEGVIDNLRTNALNKKSGLAREGAVLGIAGLCRVLGKPAQPYLFTLLPILFDLHADKGAPVREAAESAANAFFALVSPYGVKVVLPVLFEAMNKKWQSKIAALQFLGRLATVAPIQTGFLLPEIIPEISECLHDTHDEVSRAATKCMMNVCGVAGNPDIAPHLPILVSCMGHPTEVPACVQKLSATTFVAEVTGPALAIMVPLLVRALNERSAAVLRPTVVIVDNLCKLVRDPAEAGQFLPQLLPGLDRIIETAASPEVRALASAARATLVRVGGGVQKDAAPSGAAANVPSTEDATKVVKDFAASIANVKVADSYATTAIEHIVQLVRELIAAEAYSEVEWKTTLTQYIQALASEDLASVMAKAIFTHYYSLEKKRRGMESTDDDEEEGEMLCNCDFSLAYGGMMLLNHTTLRLRRGHRYGLCGANGAGKSTLMRAISRGQVENFPSPDVLRTVFVEHTLQGEDASMSILDFIASDPKLKHIAVAEKQKALEEVGFVGDRLTQEVGSLSGGWKMKLELARAMLMNADILLLDEPTNHLDVANVAWLEKYLTSQTHITCLVVSHDSGFLDNVCTNIIHYERKKLAYYKGNLSEFVKVRPEASSYYTLSSSNVKFTFPPPGFLQGITSKTKAILKMTNATFTYPGAPKPSLSNASVTLSLASRVAIVGHNGAGKSTLIKLLTGETIAQEGTVWKHPNLRIGYVAQHAFHHLDQHLEKTANTYIQWRYQGGEDREVLEKASRQLSDDEKAQMEVPIMINGQPRRVEFLLGRSKLKKSFQYEVKWIGLIHKHNTWLPREFLLEKGFQKLVQAFDDREASREGQGYRELIPAVIRKHIEDIGLDGDIADNNPLSGLSGGQKVKVVIAAAMWNNPHMLVLDEPTNFLDRDSLGGLAVAIRDWGGAVVMISHNTEFVGALCPEVWNVEAGRLTHKGKSDVADSAFEDHEESARKIAEKVAAKSGKKKLTRNEMKARDVRRRARHLKWLAEGGEKEPDTDDD
ncbi:P-loop containing nucleoside triphosphate hydrolase protein [Blyttiomyces helicus]|uniref:Elongation factor 3 n=1 Tax=Blyttiomyces helicus TaxID=388810 RepID=A0A4P9WGC3_9FUNG|nr:P-loop containing nucleoside triphosphate hydrolase protein [Blyttiomyces helicus]|eukprot:RKO91859.1 P-loop containing nucleoside triphosphate hydrolase protein [Blyttiomyces helicus]